MAGNEPRRIELSPSIKEKIASSFIAILGFILGVISVFGGLILEFQDTIVPFAAIFVGAITIFFALWRILRIFTVKLYVDPEEIRYRDRFVWKRISWSDVISIGRANDIATRGHRGVLKRIKSMIFLTDSGVQEFEMTAYSLVNGIDAINKVIESRPKTDEEEEDTENE